MVDKKVIETAVEMTKDIPATDSVLTPIEVTEEKDLTPYPEIEYMIIETTSLDKVVRDVNTQLQNGWQTEWGIHVVKLDAWTKYYQAMVRWNVDLNSNEKENANKTEGSTVEW